VTPQPPAATRPLVERHKLSFDLLSDQGNEYAARLGLHFALPEDLKEVYQGFGLDLGDSGWTLPMPGRFVVAEGGIVRAVDVDPDYRYRPEPEKALADVRALVQPP
jgi:peroxiredoxin